MITVERILALCAQHHMTAVEYCDKMGFSKSVVTGWKAGKSKPTADVIRKTAELFDVSTDYLMGMSDDPHSPKKPVDMQYLEKLREIPTMHFHLLQGIEGLDLSDRDVDFIVRMARAYKISTEGERFDKNGRK